jgi:Spy/CpxP family protein refolding chaperone
LSALTRTIVIVIVLTAVAAAAGSWAGIQYGLRETRSNLGLDDLLHHELQLSSEQNARIEALESNFAGKRTALEDEMRAANRDLATAIAAEPSYGPRARAAIERFHAAESTLQEETVKHVLSMRTVLTREQITRFDAAISKALTSDPS